jgi:hypothetical protein
MVSHQSTCLSVPYCPGGGASCRFSGFPIAAGIKAQSAFQDQTKSRPRPCSTEDLCLDHLHGASLRTRVHVEICETSPEYDARRRSNVGEPTSRTMAVNPPLPGRPLLHVVHHSSGVAEPSPVGRERDCTASPPESHNQGHG